VRVALLGVGLIGGSIGLAARERLGAHVVGWNRSPAALQTALANGAIDEAVSSLSEIGDADIAVASVSIDALPAAVREIRASVPNRPGVVAQLALELGRGGINITDMSLAPEAGNRTGMVALWVPAGDAERAIELVSGLGFPAA